ncbi:hypothetical protein BFJ66_g13196 [Fusarium oxysporum f. sp. cepae]|uniref:Uncharacterized protein n=1 Tax=Fusarium oxysporum f. sp. cepae TaxID=396571 RepID=A0A3L6MV45_FUSOX|nr:hypothetical protein BFJ65_g16455 [Fusarium oxysporum f. sp. cepae]RKK33349.1 hypothetical protein BFJ67_g14310 [Fusarium oxysporum f. sp. cepae]RKK37011.1 hypothetical protein BFJ66_g13196 [Fusarium oxysporum f. sp. cepae]
MALFSLKSSSLFSLTSRQASPIPSHSPTLPQVEEVGVHSSPHSGAHHDYIPSRFYVIARPKTRNSLCPQLPPVVPVGLDYSEAGKPIHDETIRFGHGGVIVELKNQ